MSRRSDRDRRAGGAAAVPARGRALGLFPGHHPAPGDGAGPQDPGGAADARRAVGRHRGMGRRPRQRHRDNAELVAGRRPGRAAARRTAWPPGLAGGRARLREHAGGRSRAVHRAPSERGSGPALAALALAAAPGFMESGVAASARTPTGGPHARAIRRVRAAMRELADATVQRRPPRRVTSIASTARCARPTRTCWCPPRTASP